MDILNIAKAMEKYGKCRRCGDEIINNGSKLIIEDNYIVRSCRECGYSITAILNEDGTFSEKDNSCILNN